MTDWKQLANDDTVQKVMQKLKNRGIEAQVVESGEAAKARVLELVPKNSQVMTATSTTLDTLGLTEILNESGEYQSVKQVLSSLNRETDNLKMNQLGAAPEYMVGSVHAITQDGQLVIASNSGSQLPGYAYGASHVIWVVGTHKIVSDLDTAFKRIYDFVLPLESERARKAYGVDGSNVSKLLVINKEVNPQRARVILVKENLGF